MLPKYAAVNGSLGPDIRCWTGCIVSWMCVGENKAGLQYWMGPIRTPQAPRNRTLPIDHLQ